MANVTADDVRDVVHVNSSEIPDAKVTKMLKRAEVTLELETDKEIDYSNCSDAEKEFITVLAVIYAICYLVGGSAVGLNHYDVLHMEFYEGYAKIMIYSLNLPQSF